MKRSSIIIRNIGLDFFSQLYKIERSFGIVKDNPLNFKFYIHEKNICSN